MTIEADAVPGLRRGVRLVHDPVRGQSALLYPEGVLLLDATATAVLTRCDLTRSVAGIVVDLAEAYDGVRESDVLALLRDLQSRRVVTTDGTATPAVVQYARGDAGAPQAPAPVGLLAELTYRCPLHCAYCANPVNLDDYRAELDTAQWQRVLDEARGLGILQVHFSGGEPALRRDLPDLVRHARGLGMYINLVTSGIGLSQSVLAALVGAGLDHFQLSIQDDRPDRADAVAGVRAHARKLALAAEVRAAGLPLTVNVVLHRGNVDRLLPMTELAVSLGADRVELAHTQFYGWALNNRASLMPTEAQIQIARRDARSARERYGDRLEIVHVVPDYHTGTPKPCMDGWGSRQLIVAPNGDVLPCLAAAQLPGLTVPNAREQALRAIWYHSDAFNKFRGTGWLPEPCHSCPSREVDFGGCRCQAYQLLGDPAATDPVCRLSPHHDLIARLRAPATPPTPARRRVGHILPYNEDTFRLR